MYFNSFIMSHLRLLYIKLHYGRCSFQKKLFNIDPNSQEMCFCELVTSLDSELWIWPLFLIFWSFLTLSCVYKKNRGKAKVSLTVRLRLFRSAAEKQPVFVILWRNFLLMHQLEDASVKPSNHLSPWPILAAYWMIQPQGSAPLSLRINKV